MWGLRIAYTALKTLLRHLDRILIGPTREEIEISRRKPTIFESDNLPRYYRRVLYEFDIRFENYEIEKIDNMDVLMGLARRKYRLEHDKIANSHWVWSTVNRLADEYINK